MKTIQQSAVAIVDYTLQLFNGFCIDERISFAYIHGYRALLPGMEMALEGKIVGDLIRVELSPAEAFGEYKEHAPINIHRREFGHKFDELYEGISVPLQDARGNKVVLYVESKQSSYATLTSNHPFAGQKLVFAAKVIGVRCALPEELASGVVYGVDGTEVPSSCACC